MKIKLTYNQDLDLANKMDTLELDDINKAILFYNIGGKMMAISLYEYTNIEVSIKKEDIDKEREAVLEVYKLLNN